VLSVTCWEWRLKLANKARRQKRERRVQYKRMRKHSQPYRGYSRRSIKQGIGHERLKQNIRHVILEYPEHPCGLPSCPCIVHRLGLPQADEIAPMLLPLKDVKQKSAMWVTSAAREQWKKRLLPR
jgi:hypothetical protein